MHADEHAPIDDPEADVTPNPVIVDHGPPHRTVVAATSRGGTHGWLTSIGVLLAGVGIFLIGLGCLWHAVDNNHGEGKRDMRGRPPMGMRGGGGPGFGYGGKMGMRPRGGMRFQQGQSQGGMSGPTGNVAPDQGAGSSTTAPATPTTPAPAGK